MMQPTALKNSERRWFASDEIQFAIDGQPVDSLVADLHDSVLLYKHEPLLVVLAEALANDHDWQPTSAPATSSFTHTISLLGDDELTLGVQLSKEHWAALRKVGERLQAVVKIEAHLQSWSFEINNLELDENESQSLQLPGSVLLIPETFSGAVSGEVCSGGQRIPARLEDFSVRVTGAPVAGLPATSGAADASDHLFDCSQTQGCRISVDGVGAFDLSKVALSDQAELLIEQSVQAKLSFTGATDSGADELIVRRADFIRVGEGLGLRVVEH